MNVLLIEDDAIDASYFTKQLTVDDPRFQVITETTLEDGAARCNAETFDIAVLDLNLPDSRGLENTELVLGESGVCAARGSSHGPR